MVQYIGAVSETRLAKNEDTGFSDEWRFTSARHSELSLVQLPASTS